MTKKRSHKGRRIRLAVLLTLATVALVGAAESRAQVPGFANSKPGPAASAQSGKYTTYGTSGSRRVATPSPSGVSQPVVDMRQIPETGSMKELNLGRQIGEDIRTSATGGVASMLLDELEDDNQGVPTSRQEKGKTQKKSTRRSLRDEDSYASLELLEDDSNESEDEDSNVVSTEDEEVEYEDADESFEEEETETLEEEPEPIKRSAPKARVERRPAQKVAEKRPASVEKSKKTTVLDERPTVNDETFESDVALSEQPFSKLDEQFDAYRSSVASTKVGAPEAQEEVAAVAEVQTETPSENGELSFGRAPNVEISTNGPKRLIVGQEATYRVRVRNVGDEPARKLVVTTELPESAVGVKPTVDEGSAIIESGGVRSSSNRCVWHVGTLQPNNEAILLIDLTPTKRVAFELTSQFECERAYSSADVEVQEPILEASIEGRDTIEWGVEDKYRLRLRNIGNGDAEDVELFVSTGENQARQRVGRLNAGEEKTVEMSVKTLAEDYFVIDVEATGAYGLRAVASKRVETLRGKLEVSVETPDLQFVDGEFEARVRVKNVGDAALQNVDVVAQIPEGVELVYCSNRARRNDEKRRVYWSTPFVRPNEEATFNVSCRVKSVGTAKFEAVGVDQTGVAAQAESSIHIESIAVLAMRVNAPKEPVAVGKECVYELIVENNGTRDARDVNSGVFLGSGMRPIAVEGGKGFVYENESKVLFKRIDCLKAGESVTFRVQAQALAAGNQKIQAMLQSEPEDVSLMSEETTYCYSRAAASEDSLKDAFLRETPTAIAERNIGTTIRK